jgi:hypothetical protein
MSRAVGSILVLLLAVVQGFSLCPCRAEQFVSPVASHGYTSADGDVFGDHGFICPTGGECSRSFCDSHIQAKQSNESAGATVAAVAEFDVVPWAQARVLLTPYPTSDPPACASGLFSRSTPLLI